MGERPKPILIKNIYVDRLACAIAEAQLNTIRDRAQVVGQNIRGENGVIDAIKIIEKNANEFKKNVGYVLQKKV